MGWHHLLFLHWEIEPEKLRPLVPRGLDLDLFEGRAYVGLIPFTMSRVRPRFLPGLPFAPRLYEDFHETNVRTYVRDRQGNRGVWFFSLDAASLLAVIAARTWFHLPYFWSKMTLTQTRRRNNNGTEHAIHYHSSRIRPRPSSSVCDVQIVVANEAPHEAAPDSLEHFLVERYVLFSGDDTALFRGRVRHKPYRLQAARVQELREDLLRAAHIERPCSAPHVLYAAEARVEAFAIEKVEL